MAEVDLLQAEADALLAMPKLRVDDTEWTFPPERGSVSIPLVSKDKREKFALDLSQGRINTLRIKYQNRARQVVTLARLELAGPMHWNPDGQEISCPHLHIYREGYGDKWAFPVSKDAFPNIADGWLTLHDFMRFCTVARPPRFFRGLFP